MSAPPPELIAFHYGFVVRDLDAVADRYRQILQVPRWHVKELTLAKSPFKPESTEARLKLAYGHGGGMTIELIQVLEGHCQHSEFLEAHGEGVQHIGFWTTDVRASVEAAVAGGGTVVSAHLDPDSNAIVQVTPGAAPPITSIDPRRVAYIDAGIAAVQFEFMGPSASPGLKDWLKEDFTLWLTQPPWEA